jgi:hypothetical protein
MADLGMAHTECLRFLYLFVMFFWDNFLDFLLFPLLASILRCLKTWCSHAPLGIRVLQYAERS